MAVHARVRVYVCMPVRAYIYVQLFISLKLLFVHTLYLVFPIFPEVHSSTMHMHLHTCIHTYAHKIKLPTHKHSCRDFSLADSVLNNNSNIFNCIIKSSLLSNITNYEGYSEDRKYIERRNVSSKYIRARPLSYVYKITRNERKGG